MSESSYNWTLPLISSAAPGALYEQIVDGLKREISAGRLPAGAPLPSFRQLAADLLVSVITVKRAYEELEREGIIYRRQGLGTFVAETGHDRSRATHKTEATQLFQSAVTAARQAGLSDRDILSLVRDTLNQPSEDKKP
ncbi:MAG: transcriptional regulator, GntR family [Verrucomicrobia bacterium]|jgi:GntR family transcriptional regulator|nr:transcriptional regulator, GntR family [Verrucomicrobiota bacterium]